MLDLAKRGVDLLFRGRVAELPARRGSGLSDRVENGTFHFF